MFLQLWTTLLVACAEELGLAVSHLTTILSQL